MEQTLTVSCKLKTSPQQAEQINATLKAFADACSWVNLNTPAELTNPTRMHHLVYRDVRAFFGLSANLSQQVFRRVCGIRRSRAKGVRKTAKQKGKKVKQFAPTSASYDARIFTFRECDWSVGLRLLDGKVWFPLAIGNYQRHLLKEQNPTSATLVKRKDGSHYINIQVENPVPDPGGSVPEESSSGHLPSKVKGCLGVDLGRVDIAHTSKGDKFCGQQLKQVRDKYAELRAGLSHRATKGTRSARRRIRALQQRLSGRERRFQTWLNHTISHQIVQAAKTNQCSIALENLSGIRGRTIGLRPAKGVQQPRNKTERRRGNSWAFFQLRQFLTYKALGASVPLMGLNPAWTSQTCHCCHRVGNRQGKKFSCGGCRWHGDSDYNAAVVLSQMGQSVNLARGSGLHCELEGF